MNLVMQLVFEQHVLKQIIQAEPTTIRQLMLLQKVSLVIGSNHQHLNINLFSFIDEMFVYTNTQ